MSDIDVDASIEGLHYQLIRDNHGTNRSLMVTFSVVDVELRHRIVEIQGGEAQKTNNNLNSG